MSLSILGAAALSLSLAQASSPLRVLVVTGGHDYPTSFYTLFEQPGLTWDHMVSAEEAYRDDLRSRYDVLVLYDMPRTLTDRGKLRLRMFAEAGKGIVVLHHSIVSYPDWDWYRDLIGARYLEQPQGDRPASTYSHEERMNVAVAAVHPVTAGLAPFSVLDESYKGMWLAPTNTVLLSTDNANSDRPVAWVSAYPSSRVVTIQLGHGSECHRDASYRRLVLNAIIWTGTRHP